MGGSQSRSTQAQIQREVDITDADDKIGQLTDAQLQEFKEAFDQYDSDGSGSIEAPELKNLMESIGSTPSDDEVVEMIRIADADGSGSVDFFEFVTLMAHKMGEVKDTSMIEKSFKIFDIDGSGYIEQAELRRIMINVGEPVTAEDVQDIFKELDKDNDGRISFTEFTKVVASEETQDLEDEEKDPVAAAAARERKLKRKQMRARINRRMS